MSKSSFQKKPTSYPEQIQQLKSRGLMMWRARLINLIRQHEIQVKMMGFPADWEERDIWCRQPF